MWRWWYLFHSDTTAMHRETGAGNLLHVNCCNMAMFNAGRKRHVAQPPKTKRGKGKKHVK